MQFVIEAELYQQDRLGNWPRRTSPKKGWTSVRRVCIIRLGGGSASPRLTEVSVAHRHTSSSLAGA